MVIRDAVPVFLPGNDSSTSPAAATADVSTRTLWFEDGNSLHNDCFSSGRRTERGFYCTPSKERIDASCCCDRWPKGKP